MSAVGELVVVGAEVGLVVGLVVGAEVGLVVGAEVGAQVTAPPPLSSAISPHNVPS